MIKTLTGAQKHGVIEAICVEFAAGVTFGYCAMLGMYIHIIMLRLPTYIPCNQSMIKTLTGAQKHGVIEAICVEFAAGVTFGYCAMLGMYIHIIMLREHLTRDD